MKWREYLKQQESKGGKYQRRWERERVSALLGRKLKLDEDEVEERPDGGYIDGIRIYQRIELQPIWSKP